MIECVAILFGGKIYSMSRPSRHCDVIRWIFEDSDPNKTTYVGSRGQGFLTDKGKFLNRNDSEIHARECGQLTGKLIGSVLTSEDLW